MAANVPMQVNLVKGGTRRSEQVTVDVQVVSGGTALLSGISLPVVNNLTVAPTQADFNNLLAALRTRGVIGGS
ncbi:hypothetical protein [Kitasatospora sp. CB01950]|uniref:hypothetical protein n=1 Tax=Kitasatospora sp. CB01950 TaxID=1703930 RepID=UPI00093AC37F|nr:hypothetical protein [Kitasatospora sp. CB01950]OKJ06820.1 hypothetical protein AMK19_23510 [Kitasatospora sp. CB01950]